MIRALTMPKWGIEMQEGTLNEWLLDVGDNVNPGDLVVTIESDKVVNELESGYSGVLRLKVASEGEIYPVGALLGVIADSETSDAEIQTFVESFTAADVSTAAGGDTADEEAEIPSAVESSPARPEFDRRRASPAAYRLAVDEGLELDALAGSGRGNRLTLQDVQQASREAASPTLVGPLPIPPNPGNHFASPAALRVAAEQNVNLESLKPTGPRGRLSKQDVLGARPAGAAPASLGADLLIKPPLIKPMDGTRRVIARRLTQAKQSIPHFYVRMDLPVDPLLARRQSHNETAEERASVNDFLLHAVSRTLVRHPDVNVQVHESDIHCFAQADMALAIATDRGLFAPVIKAADRLSIAELARTTSELARRAAAGSLTGEDLQGGTITVSNLGMFGIDGFDAIINPPQGSILAVGGIRRVWTEREDGSCRFESRIAVSMACDHRAIDGAVAARFLADLRQQVQESFE